jgi:hypothetical protein
VRQRSAYEILDKPTGAEAFLVHIWKRIEGGFAARGAAEALVIDKDLHALPTGENVANHLRFRPVS